MNDAPVRRFYSYLNQSNIPALNGIRALAVIAVVLHHLNVGTTWEIGDLGVIAFFVLSGFLITWLILKEYEQNGTVSIRHFYLRRALRLLPAFYVFFVAYIAIAAVIHRPGGWDQYLAAFFYFNDYYRWIHPSGHIPMDHTWSLAVEEQFYLLWPWVCVVWCKCERRKLLPVLFSTIALIEGGRIVYQLFFSGDHAVVYYSFHTRADSLAIGCLLAVLFKSGKHYRFLEVLIRNACAPIVVFLLLALSLWPEQRLGWPYQHVVGLLVWPILLAVLIVQMIAFSDRPVWGWINAEPLNTMGKWSYSAYLWHWLIDFAVMTRLAGLPGIIKVLVAISASFAVAALSYYFVERPFLRLKDRFKDHVAVGRY